MDDPMDCAYTDRCFTTRPQTDCALADKSNPTAAGKTRVSVNGLSGPRKLMVQSWSPRCVLRCVTIIILLQFFHSPWDDLQLYEGYFINLQVENLANIILVADFFNIDIFFCKGELVWWVGSENLGTPAILQKHTGFLNFFLPQLLIILKSGRFIFKVISPRENIFFI